jgi:small subunit ribosomal protein S6e
VEEFNMADFKLCIADPKSGKTYQKEVKDNEAAPFLGKNIGDAIKGETIGMTGYELVISGGSDNCGFPMRRGIKGLRKRLTLLGGVGLRKNYSKGVQKRKTVCGHKINDNISQINLKVTKEGSKKLEEVLGAPAEAGEKPAEEKKEEPKKEEKKAEEAPKEEKNSNTVKVSRKY